jgi:hypothetical protein
MTPGNPALSRTITLRSSSGRPLARVGLVPAAAAVAAGLVLAPRLTAIAAIGGLLRGVSLTVDGDS